MCHENSKDDIPLGMSHCSCLIEIVGFKRDAIYALKTIALSKGL